MEKKNMKGKEKERRKGLHLSTTHNQKVNYDKQTL
uniref:Uncharacterized protein n=1 Tax=Rhizophora mucronata TaxID=61149 RepID=A0A2P2NFC0_RHIMU